MTQSPSRSSNVLLDAGVSDYARVGHGTPPQSQTHLLSRLSLLKNSNRLSFFQGSYSRYPRRGGSSTHRLEPRKDLFFSEPSALHDAHLLSTILGGCGPVTPGAETTGRAQIVNAFGAPFMLEGLFCEADAEAMDANPDSEPAAADNIGMGVEDDTGSGLQSEG
jgi:hypothetical protein